MASNLKTRSRFGGLRFSEVLCLKLMVYSENKRNKSWNINWSPDIQKSFSTLNLMLWKLMKMEIKLSLQKKICCFFSLLSPLVSPSFSKRKLETKETVYLTLFMINSCLGPTTWAYSCCCQREDWFHGKRIRVLKYSGLVMISFVKFSMLEGLVDDHESHWS